MPTLVIPPRFNDDIHVMRKAAMDADWRVERLSSWRAETELRFAGPVLYGEPLFAAVVANTLELSLIEPPFHWLTTLPFTWTGRQILFTALGDARTEPNRRFIKPADDKCFPARIYNSGTELPVNQFLSEETPVLVSDPVRWGVEFRCFVLDGALQTLSIYSRDGDLAQGIDGTWEASPAEFEQARKFIEEFLAENQSLIPPAVVVDVGLIVGHGWAVVEANPAWGSGIYGCDPTSVLNVIRRACIAREELSPADALWVRTQSD